MPGLPSPDSHSARSRQNRAIRARVRKNLGHLRPGRKRAAAQKHSRPAQTSRATRQMSEAPEREEAIFKAALELPPEQRADYLRNGCGDDHELRARVEGLLQANENAGGFMQPPARNKT